MKKLLLPSKILKLMENFVPRWFIVVRTIYVGFVVFSSDDSKTFLILGLTLDFYNSIMTFIS